MSKVHNSDKLIKFPIRMQTLHFFPPFLHEIQPLTLMASSASMLQ